MEKESASSLKLAAYLSDMVNHAFESGEMLEKVTPVTAELLKYWFTSPFTDERSINFHDGQRQAILNIIYLHEVLSINKVSDIYEQVAPYLMREVDMTALSEEKYNFPKYAVKMATGTGKTWVMHALLLWQLLNARHEEVSSGRYTKHFLVVAPGLVVYDRLLDAFKGRLKSGSEGREPETNDFVRSQDLFIPPVYRHEVFSFIQNNTVSKEEGIGKKTTGEGLIALTNWHLFLSHDSDDTREDDDSPQTVVKSLLPVSPGITAGNSLEALDNQYFSGQDIEYLADLPDLMVINDEAHHIHENKIAGEREEVQWQKGLNTIAHHKKSFFQVDFSATPYISTGTGKRQKKCYFPHIIVDFDLATAMRQGLVKTLLLDKRQSLTELEDLDYKAERDERDKVIGLSKGQRLMLRAGLRKIHILEENFVDFDEHKHPKMLVMCEDTNVTPFVERFLIEEGLAEEDVLRIDSTRKGELKKEEWVRIKERLFNVDRYASPKVIVSVLMLREGFDVNNICVIVPLRSSTAPILLEQTIGRGLRLMWREEAYQETKKEDRRLVLSEHKQPTSYLDMLSIIEHPKFTEFYEQLMAEGLAGTDSEEMTDKSDVLGDLIKVNLKANYQDYAFSWPLIIRDAEEEITPKEIDVNSLEPFTLFPLETLRQYLATPGETFIAQAVLTQAQFGKYRVLDNLFTAVSYGDYLQKLLRRVTTRIDRVGRKDLNLPTLQINQSEITRIIDTYIRTRLFGVLFNPFHENDWKILLSKGGMVTEHIVKQLSIAIHKMQESVMVGEADVRLIPFSSVKTLVVRETYSLELEKVMYERLGYSSHGGGFEKKFMRFLDLDADVERFLKINESKHVFATIYYIRTDGLPASYHPDFIVATMDKIYLVETKGDDKINDRNVRQKQLAAINLCNKINQLQPKERMDREWEYVLLRESDFDILMQNGATFSDMCRLHPVTIASVQERLF